MMFAQDQPRIQAALASQGTHGLRKVILFAVATIRAQFTEVAASMPALYEGRKPNGRVWFGHKWSTLDWLARPGNLERLALRARLAELQSDDSQQLADALVGLFASTVPCVGLAKAGFIVQLRWGLSGCFDAHNIRMYSIPATLVRPFAKGTRAATIRRRANAYNRTILAQGGTASLWDQWCRYVAAEGYFPGTAEDASRLHLTALGVD